MENASRALLMAASILLGVMIVSVGVALFNSFGGFSKNIMNEIEEARIAEFNAQFLKYYGEIYNEETMQKEKIKLTTHDVVSLANLAAKNNIEHQVEDENEKNEKTYYIQIVLEMNKKTESYETKTEEELKQFILDNNMYYNSDDELCTKYFYVDTIEISPVTKRVIYVKIKELTEDKKNK